MKLTDIISADGVRLAEWEGPVFILGWTQARNEFQCGGWGLSTSGMVSVYFKPIGRWVLYHPSQFVTTREAAEAAAKEGE